MAKKTPKTKIVAFKIEQELAEFLNNLPNKSEYIRKAIIARFGMTCPLCTGSGVVARGLHTHYKPIIDQQDQHPCDKCGVAETIPLSLEGVADTDRKRMEQFMHGGPLYCEKCYAQVPACDDCGWHIPHEEVADHFRQIHAH